MVRSPLLICQYSRHAHKQLNQILIATSGSFNVILDDGYNREIITLNRPYQGLHIPPMVWRELDNFSSGGVCLAIVSEFFDEDDYIRDYNDFKKMINKDNMPNKDSLYNSDLGG